jgi:nucleotide-binding universal stress UspA family protein
MFKHLLVCHDFSEGAAHALALGVSLARLHHADITLLHAGITPDSALGLDPHGPGAVLVQMNEHMARERHAAVERVARSSIPSDVSWRLVVRDGYPPEVILAEAGSGDYDLLVLGTHGRSGIQRVLLGSVAARVIQGATIPVLVTR